MENVGALTFRGLDAVLGSLSEIGYNAEWQDIRASDMGAPHKRERIWIVAYPNTSSIRRTAGGDYERQHADNIFEIRETEENQQSGSIGKCGACEIRTINVADTDRERCEELHLAEKPDKQGFNRWTAIENTGCKHGEEGMQVPGGLRGQQKERDTRNQLERPGSTRIWDETIESRITRMDDGVSRKMDGDRLRGIGNAIVPQIAELLFNQIKVYL